MCYGSPRHYCRISNSFRMHLWETQKYALRCSTDLSICPTLASGGADLRRVTTLVNDPVGSGPMSIHSTHVASAIFDNCSIPKERG